MTLGAPVAQIAINGARSCVFASRSSKQCAPTYWRAQFPTHCDAAVAPGPGAEGFYLHREMLEIDHKITFAGHSPQNDNNILLTTYFVIVVIGDLRD
jgi:hypothetical protein